MGHQKHHGHLLVWVAILAVTAAVIRWLWLYNERKKEHEQPE